MPTFQQDARITVKKRNVTWTHDTFWTDLALSLVLAERRR
jgi:hypothetical protein